jgi:transcriptional regulator with XRE-family HTH domain
MNAKNKPGRGKEIRLENSLRSRQDLRLFTMLAAPESDFLELVRRLESDPLFRKLAAPAGGRQVISRTRRGASYSWDYNLGDSRLLSVPDSLYISGELLSARPEALKLAQRLGAADFEKYFLDENDAPEEICRATGLKPAEVSRIRDFTAAFLQAHENLPVPAMPAERVRLVALVCRSGRGLELSYLHPAYARGGYKVDRDALERLRKSGGLTRGELVRLGPVLKAVELFNWRKKGLQRTLEGIVKFQREFFSGGAMKPLSQRAFAAGLSLNPSTISRLIAGRSLKTPDMAEVRLKDFFPSKKEYIIDKIRRVMARPAPARCRLSDRMIACELRERFGIKVSRRTVNLYKPRDKGEAQRGG